MRFNFYVSADNPHLREQKYNGDEAADAMAAWSKAVTDGAEYAVLEALREDPPIPARGVKS